MFVVPEVNAVMVRRMLRFCAKHLFQQRVDCLMAIDRHPLLVTLPEVDRQEGLRFDILGKLSNDRLHVADVLATPVLLLALLRQQLG